jgi:uncharacterized membrane protein YczE
VRPTLRGAALLVGLACYGFSMAMMVRAGLGLDPWDVFHQGLTRHTPMSIGVASAVVGVVVLLAWIPLRNKPGIGTVANVIVIAITVDGGLAVLAAPESMPARIAMMLAAVVLNAVATVLYVGAGLGPGPRDGLMTGLVARTGLSVRLVRTAIEATVLTAGWLLGGSLGVGTVIYAFGIGPMVQLVLRLTPKPILAVSGWAPIVGHARNGSDPRSTDRDECGTMVQCPTPQTRSIPTC